MFLLIIRCPCRLLKFVQISTMKSKHNTEGSKEALPLISNQSDCLQLNSIVMINFTSKSSYRHVFFFCSALKDTDFILIIQYAKTEKS